MKKEAKIIEEQIIEEGTKSKKGKIAVAVGVAATALAGIGFGIYKVVTGKKNSSEDSLNENE